jgi:hypothetical protein
MIIKPNTNIAKRGVVIGSIVNLDHGLGRFLANRSLSRSLPIANIKVVGTPQMVFTNPIMITHEHKTIYKPLMSSITVGRYRNIDAEDLKVEYRKPFVMT